MSGISSFKTETHGVSITTLPRIHQNSNNYRHVEEKCRNLDAEARFHKDEKKYIANELFLIKCKTAAVEKENEDLKKQIEDMKQTIADNNMRIKESSTKVAGLKRKNKILKQSVRGKDKRMERINRTTLNNINEFETDYSAWAFEQSYMKVKFTNYPWHVTRDWQHRERSSNTSFELRYCQNCEKCCEDISDLQAEVENLQDRNTDKELLLQKSISKIVCLEAAIDRLTSEIVTYKENKEQLNIAVTQLKREKNALEEKFSRQTSADISTRQLQAKIVQLQSTIAKHETENEKQNEHAEELKKEKFHLEERIRQTSADITTRQLQAEIVQLKSTIARNDREKEKLNEHAEELKKEKRQLEENIRQTSADITTRQLQAEIVQLKSTITRHERENDQLSEQAEELKKEKRQLEERISRQTSADITTRQLQAEIVQLKSTITRHERENDQLSEHAEDFKREKRQLEERIRRQTSEDITKSQLEAEIVQLKSTIARHERENEKLSEHAENFKREKRKLEEKISQQISADITTRQFQAEIVQLKSTIARHERENDELNKHAEELKEKRQLEENIRQTSADITTRQLQAEIVQLKATIASHKRENEKLSEHAAELKKKNHQLEEKIRQRPSETLTDTLDCQNCWKYRKDISDLSAEVNTLRNRLSEAAGNKLRDNNPNIADLSDLNRPTSLAEKFSSLYTDEYTDAMEVIEGTMDEQASAMFMLQLLQNCYDWSRKLAEEQRHKLSTDSFGFMKKYLKQASNFKLSDRCLIYVKDFQKKIATDGDNLSAVEMVCLENSLKQANLNSNQNMKKYVKKCSLLCWMMQISDPPIYLNFDVTVGEKLDTNIYNVYTKSGSQIKFLVWPAIYMYQAGPLLAKGVAQGK